MERSHHLLANIIIYNDFLFFVMWQASGHLVY